MINFEETNVRWCVAFFGFLVISGNVKLSFIPSLGDVSWKTEVVAPHLIDIS